MSHELRGAKRWLFPLVAGLLVAAAMVGGAEVALRVYHVFKDRRAAAALPPVERRALVPSTDPELVWELNPGWTDGTFTVNSIGMADEETTFEKPEGVVRIAFVGDSITCNFGHCPRPEIYLEVLGRALDETRSDGPRVETLNLGVNGYGALQVARAAESSAVRFDPDIVIAQFCLNDPYPSNTDYGRFQPGPVSRLYDFVARRVAPARFWARWYVERGYDADGRARIARALERVAALEDRGIHVAGVLFPYRYGPAYARWDFERYHDIWRERAEAAGLPWLDLHAAFAREGRLTDAWPIDPIHPEPPGHAVAAEAIRRMVTDRGWIERADRSRGGTPPE